MARVVVTPTARSDLERLIRTHSLPPTTRDRVRRSLELLGEYPSIGARLEGRWSGYRFVLGPWRWLVVVYEYDQAADRVAVVTFQDGRMAGAPRSG